MPNSMLMARTLASILMLLMSPGLIDTSAVNTAAVVPVDREAMGYWTRWRGPSGQGTVAGGDYPDTWSDTINVKWRSTVPGRGHSSPIVWKDHIFLTTARDDGAASRCSRSAEATADSCGKRSCRPAGVERTYCEEQPRVGDADDRRPPRLRLVRHARGRRVRLRRHAWPGTRSSAIVSNYHGSAGSPVLYKDRLFIYQDHDGSATLRSFVAAFDTRTGNVMWKTDRDRNRSAGARRSWSPPAIATS